MNCSKIEKFNQMFILGFYSKRTIFLYNSVYWDIISKFYVQSYRKTDGGGRETFLFCCLEIAAGIANNWSSYD